MKPAIIACLLLPSLTFAAETDWPPVTREAKPWLQWSQWTSLSDILAVEALGHVKTTGFGGIVLRQEARGEKSAAFLSGPWFERLLQITADAGNQDLGVDWSIFAPHDWIAASSLTTINQEVEGGGPVKIKFPEGKVEALRAYPETGKPVNLAPQVKKGEIVWEMPEGKWRLLGLFSKTASGQHVLDPFSAASTKTALKTIDQAFSKATPPLSPRASFHPALAPTGPVWSSGLLEAFQKNRGYDLRDQLPAFFGTGEPDATQRVRSDYRQTLDELYRSHLQVWQDWAAKKKLPTRLQTQDALGNIVDQAAMVDIPEILIARPATTDQFPQLVFAPSAAHLLGKPLIAASLSSKDLQLKQTADLLWLAGVNHLMLDEAPAPFLTAYIARCQSFLQAGKPAAGLLVYYPEADLWHQPAAASDDGKAFSRSAFHRTVIALWNAGISFDVVSDHLLAKAKVQDGKILIGNQAYSALMLPECRVLPEATALHLADLTKKGMKLLLTGSLPATVPGFHQTEKRVASLVKNLASIPPEACIRDSDPVGLARQSGLRSEPCAQLGLQLIRRDLEDGHAYFIVNPHAHPVDEWLPLSVAFTSAVMLDPSSADRTGVAKTRNILGSLHVRLVLNPGESRVLRTYTTHVATGPEWKD